MSFTRACRLRGLAALLALGAMAVAASPAAAVTSSTQAIADLNAQRAANGIPAGIVDNPTWDSDCALHDNWLSLNHNAANPHDETPGTPGYTTAGAWAGANAVLIAWGTSDWQRTSQFPWGTYNPWEQLPIHLMQLLGPGLSQSGWAEDGSDCMITWPGYQRPQPAAPQLFTYPGNGTSFIYASESAAGESPFNPGQFVGLGKDAVTGPYLFVLAWGTSSGALSAASLTGPAGPVPVKTVDNDTTGPLGDLGAYMPPGGIIIPVTQLISGETYTASATFTPDYSLGAAPTPPEAAPPPAPLSITWSFTVAGERSDLRGFLAGDTASASTSAQVPVTLVVRHEPSGKVAKHLQFNPDATVRLHLPAGRYRGCFSQPASPGYLASGRRCVRGSWKQTTTRHDRGNK